MKKKIVVVLVMSLVVSLYGCSNNQSNKSKRDVSITESTINTDIINNMVNEYGLAKDLEQGAILHAWCWSFNSIKENISEIAASGFTSIQTSPISQCLVGENGGMQISGVGKWYYHYQPTKYVIGNYQLGTEEEFVAMCEEAHKYGMNIIVDSVINHCTATYSEIDSSLTDIEGGGFHQQSGNWSQNNRFELTQYALSGLWDLNSQNPNIQQLVKNFLVSCVEAGADGFRYDAAKLTELPDDEAEGFAEFSSEFWPVVLENGSKWQYGEDLQEGGEDATSSRLSEYAKLMDVTASFYGERMREAVNTDNLAIDYIEDYLVGDVNEDSLVLWVESHDNYCNDASYSYLDTQEVIQAWAVIAARKGGTPIFFDRPMGSSADNPWGNNEIGAAGSNMYKDAQVVAVNFFRNETGGENEYLSNPNENKTVLMIERGIKGAVIINSSDSDTVLDGAKVQLKDGNYTDQVYGSKFSVKDGMIYGSVKAGKVAVVYNRESIGLTFASIVEVAQTSGDFLTEELDLDLATRGCKLSTYQIGDNEPVVFMNGETIKVGAKLATGESVTITLKGTDSSGKEVTDMATFTKKVAKEKTVIYFDSASVNKWEKVNVYLYNDGATDTNASWPGIEMESAGNGIYRYVVPYKLESVVTNVIFNNGSGGDGNQFPTTAGLVLTPDTQMIYNGDGEWTQHKGE